MRHIGEYEEEYRFIQRWHVVLCDIAVVLEPETYKTSKSVESNLEAVLIQMQANLTHEEDMPFVENVLNYSRGFWKGLFACYDTPLLPRTNNDLELFFRSVKRKHRRMTGSRTWNQYIIRHGELIVLVENVASQQRALERIQRVPYKDYQNKNKEWENRLEEHRKQRRFKRNPEAFLKEIENRWARHN